jgi:hypothetical protein
MLLTVDDGGLIRSIGRFGAQQVGYASEELIGKPQAIPLSQGGAGSGGKLFSRMLQSFPAAAIGRAAQGA